MSDGRCAISWHGVPCRYGCNDPKPPSPSREIAEKIWAYLEYQDPPVDYPTNIEHIESLIDGALEEAMKEYRREMVDDYNESISQTRKEARSAAIEECFKIADNHYCKMDEGEGDCGSYIAKEIKKLKEK